MNRKYQVIEKNQATVVFASALDYFDPKTQTDLKPMNENQLVFQGRRELVLECKDHILFDKLISLPQETLFSQIKVMTDFMEKEGNHRKSTKI